MVSLVSNQVLHVLKTGCDTLADLALSADGQFLAAACDKTTHVWKPAAGNKPVGSFDHPDQLTCLAFSPRGYYLATGCSDQNGRIWSVDDGKCIAILPGHPGPVYHLAWSQDGSTLVTAAKPHDPGLVAGRADRKTCHAPNSIRDLTFTPDARELLLTTHGGTPNTAGPGMAHLWFFNLEADEAAERIVQGRRPKFDCGDFPQWGSSRRGDAPLGRHENLQNVGRLQAARAARPRQ